MHLDDSYSSPHTSAGSYVFPTHVHGVEDVPMPGTTMQNADQQSQELQEHLSRREAELRDKEREVEAQRLELVYSQHLHGGQTTWS